MKKLVVFLSLIVSMFAFAGFQGLSGSESLGIFNRIECSTGLTCTKDDRNFKIVSSPTVTGGAITITGDEATDGILNIQADQADDNGDSWQILSDATDNSLDFTNDTSGSAVVKWEVATDGNVTMVGSLTGDGGDALSGFLQNQVASSTTTLTAAQCGSTIIGGGTHTLTLPEASTVLGCRYTFINSGSDTITVDPNDGTDQILVLTNAAGDSLTNGTAGNSLVIEAIGDDAWAPVGAEKGTWTDAN